MEQNKNTRNLPRNIALLSTILVITCFPMCRSTNSVHLYKHLFETNRNYTSMVRPVKHDASIVHVKVKFLLRGISDFDEVAGQLALALAVDLRWQDEFMYWNTSDYKVRTLILPENQIWLPRLSLVNPTDRILLFSEDEFSVRIYPTGGVIWLQGGTIRSTCTPNVEKYPFDVHICNVTVMPLNYIQTEVILIPEIDVNHFKNFGEWELANYTTTTEPFSLFSSVILTLTIKRKPEFSILSIIVPILFLGVLNACVFLLPVESGERVSYGITVLLSFAVFLTIISGMMPKNSEPVPILCYVLTCMMGISGLIMLCVTAGLRLYYKDPDLPVPSCIAVLCKPCCDKQATSIDNNGQLMNALSNHSARIPVFGVPTSKRVTWRDASKCLDTFFFWIFMILFVFLVVLYLLLVFPWI